jgi:transketolase
MPFIKPMDTEALVKASKETKGIVVAEDHSIYGGLYSAISEQLAMHAPCKILPVAVQDTFGESAKPDELYEKYGLSVANILAQVKSL